MKWKLPPVREFGWKMKPLDSATTSFDIVKGSVYRLNIEHSEIHGVTPDMLLWWFQNIGGFMDYNGTSYPRYLVWHPFDHIHWSLARSAPSGGVGVGAQFRIVEAFGRDLNQLVDSVETVEKLDTTGIRLTRTIAGLRVFSLEHRFSASEQGTRYSSQMIVGSPSFPLGTFFTKLVRPFLFTEAMGYAWLKHNVEEVGNFEFFLPGLFAATPRSANGA